MALSERTIGVACALATVCIWTGFIVSGRYGTTTSLGPFDMMALRFGIAGAVMAPVLWRIGLSPLGHLQALAIATTAGLVFALAAYNGFARAPATHSAILMPGLLPLLTTALAAIVLGDRPGRRRLAFLGVIFAGVCVLGRETLGELGAGYWVGDLLYVLTVSSWAVFTILARVWRISPLRAAAVVSVYTCVLYLPVYLVFLPKRIASAPLGDIVLQGTYHGIFASVLALLVYTRAVQALGPSLTTMITALTPAFVSLAGVLLLGEAMSAWMVVGLVLVTAGISGSVGRADAPPAGG